MNNINTNQKWESMTWMERIDIVRVLSLFPALTVLVFIRYRLGLRMLKPAWLVTLTIIMLAITATVHEVVRPLPVVMVAYALAMLGLGLWQRWQRWDGLFHKGERIHTRSPGISHLERFRWPRFMKLHRRINRYCDPAVVAIVGLIVGLVLSHGLGLWLIFSAFFLYVYENDLYHRQLENVCNTWDNMLASQVQAEVVEMYKDGQTAETQPLSLEQTAGIPVGIGPDIALKAKKFNVPDNLAVTRA